MMTLLMAAAVSAQPAPLADPHGRMAGMRPGQHAMKDCCKDCCKDMANKEGHGGSDEHADHAK